MQLHAGIGLLGCGTVGGAVATRLHERTRLLAQRSGVVPELRAIAIADRAKARPSSLPTSLFSYDPRAVVDDPRNDLILECIGGVGEAAELVERALDRGRHVITANKELMATQGPRLRALAAARGATLRYEAAVGGAVPIVRTLHDALAGDDVIAMAGILNGTCNAILSNLEAGIEYDDAVRDAQRRGYAEADPAADVGGDDAAHKLALLIQRAFGLAVISPRIRRRGIDAINRRDIARARMLGMHVRLVAAAIRTPDGALAEVAPVLVPHGHEFARTAGADNVVVLHARDAGPLTLRGQGAGGAATASAVLGDVVTVLRALRDHPTHPHETAPLEPALRVDPFFSTLPHRHELPQYPLWDDLYLTQAPAAQDDLAYSWPRKERSS